MLFQFGNPVSSNHSVEQADMTQQNTKAKSACPQEIVPFHMNDDESQDHHLFNKAVILFSQ
jgi:hypothetical protein